MAMLSRTDFVIALRRAHICARHAQRMNLSLKVPRSVRTGHARRSQSSMGRSQGGGAGDETPPDRAARNREDAIDCYRRRLAHSAAHAVARSPEGVLMQIGAVRSMTYDIEGLTEETSIKIMCHAIQFMADGLAAFMAANHAIAPEADVSDYFFRPAHFGIDRLLERFAA